MLEQIITSMPMFVCGVLAIELMLSLKQRWDIPKAWLLLWASTATVLYACHLIYFRRVVSWLIVSDILYVVCNLLVFPLYLIYIYKLTDERRPSYQLLSVGLGYGLLVLSAGIAVAVLYLLMPSADIELFRNVYLYGNSHEGLSGLPMAQALVHDVCKFIFAIGVMLTAVIGSRRLKRYNLLVDQLYADTEEKSLRDLAMMLGFFVLTAALSLIVNLLGRQWFLPTEDKGLFWLLVPSLLFSVMLCVIGWMGLMQKFSISDVTADMAESEEAHTDPNRLAPVAEAFVKLMDKEHLYLQSDLRLQTVVKRMGTNRTYLLHALNAELGTSFTEYVNRRRIAYACQLMARSPHMKRQELALACGYNSASSFYRNYRKYAPKD